MPESDKSAYVVKHGNFVIINAGSFTGIPNSGVIMKAQGTMLGDKFSMKDVGDDEMAAFKLLEQTIGLQMEENYNFVDETANGDSLIIGKAGLNSSSDNTTRVGIPLDFSNLKYSFTRFPNQIKVEWKADESAYGSVTFTTTEADISLVQSGISQLKLTMKGIDIFIDLTTKSSVVIDHLAGGSTVKTRAVSFNTNGMNPLAVMQGIVVPSALV